MDQYTRSNLDLWNEMTEINANSKFYGLDAFKQGQTSLKSIELEEVGDVSGKSLLHLQCHFGMDTISWARMGATVTGIDFSDKAIARARELAGEVGITARFIHSTVYDLPEKLSDEFDIVFTSYGVLCWLPDLTRWAEIVARYLKPGGTFYIAEIHPAAGIFDDSNGVTHLQVCNSYFHDPEPIRWEPDGSYADREAEVKNPSYEWTHSVSDIINALIGAGLRIEFLHEFPLSVHQQYPFMVECKDGWWRLPNNAETLPLLFSLKARKGK